MWHWIVTRLLMFKLPGDVAAVVYVPSWGLSVGDGSYFGRRLIWHVGPFLICT